jgi:hypothetical protein
MPQTDTDSADNDVGSDRLRGVPSIAKFMNEDKRRVSYLIERGILPVGREGTAIIASKARLRRYHRESTGGEAA